MEEKQELKFNRSIGCRTYPEEFRRKIVQEYLDSGRPKLHIQKEHNIRYKSAINKWLVDFGINDPYSKKAYLSKRIIIDLKKENEINLSNLSTADLEKKVADLERKLEDEQKYAAMTRKHEIENGGSFNPSRDKVVLVPLTDLAIYGKQVEVVQQANSAYGKTVEVGIWSHGGPGDGPLGSTFTSENSVDLKQMSIEGWSKINFNWAENARFDTYGCRTGMGKNSFTEKFSKIGKFKNVTVSGSSNASYPSLYTNFRDNGGRGWSDFELEPNVLSVSYPSPNGLDNFRGRTIGTDMGDKGYNPVYQVSSPRRHNNEPSLQRNYYKNGKQLQSKYQSGRTK